jgi:hypothetical protein
MGGAPRLSIEDRPICRPCQGLLRAHRGSIEKDKKKKGFLRSVGAWGRLSALVMEWARSEAAAAASLSRTSPHVVVVLLFAPGGIGIRRGRGGEDR